MTRADGEERPGRAAEINRNYYAEVSAGTDDYWNLMAAPRFRVKTILRLLKEEVIRTIVDLGCGNGRLLSEIAHAHPLVGLTGVDLSISQIDANRAAKPEIEWQCLDLSEPLPPNCNLIGRFDAVIASEIIEHLDDPEVFLRNALAMAFPMRGRLILSTQSGPIRETERRVGHCRHFDRSTMWSLLEDCGWKPVKVWNSGFPLHDLSKWYANRDPDASMRRFGERRYGAREQLICQVLRVAFLFNSKRRGAQLFAVARPREGAQ